MSNQDKQIVVIDLFKTYFLDGVEVPAIHGISLGISTGEFTAIMGASGSGKSTLMNILGCLDRPTGGVYMLEGVDVRDLSRDEMARIRNEKIGFVFQGFNLLPRTSALENVELPLYYKDDIPAKKRKKLAKEALSTVGLEEREKHHPGQLSGGEQQRVSIARALVNKPSIILADEPTGNLDSKTGREIMEIFHNLNRELKKTIILVTHDQDIARFAKRKIKLKDGVIVEDSSLNGVNP
ncbi:MAG: ABC transporter ATP-binding protein [Deltaproteobacteria bacterium]|nr:ABC transporter ATP-binding protein [Deltaproteobacteria bacterium]RLB22281.1 MAG: macrolide ABC transporter ATP-binding protein [Deltaproteobacteria bacterium]